MEGVGKVDSCEVGALAFSLLAKLIRLQCNGEAASLKMEIWEACSDGNRFCISNLSISSSIQVIDHQLRGGVHIDPFKSSHIEHLRICVSYMGICVCWHRQIAGH